MLHDLVVLRKKLLETYDTSRVQEEILRLRQQIETVKTTVPHIEQHNLDYVDQLIGFYNQALSYITGPDQAFKDKIREIDQQIAEVSHRLFANNYELEERDGGIENVRRRVIPLRSEVEELIKQRINIYTSWQYPTLEIGCREGDWTSFLVAADPLYVMDKYQEFIDATNQNFSEHYQHRLRKYPLKDYDFSVLPQGQFGFIFSWGHFNYVSLDTITQVLKKVSALLRPGGIFLFSYNDGDTPTGAGMAENFAQSYIPQSILVPTCQSLGFEVVRTFNEEPNISWIEIKKPGTLKTIKAHQVLGKIERRMP